MRVLRSERELERDGKCWDLAKRRLAETSVGFTSKN